MVTINNMSNRLLLLSLMKECKKGSISEMAQRMFVEALQRLEAAQQRRPAAEGSAHRVETRCVALTSQESDVAPPAGSVD